MSPKADPAILEVHAGLAAVKAMLLGVGATAPGQRSVAFALHDHLLLLAYDEDERSTTIAVGGPRTLETARWLRDELDGSGLHVTKTLPPPAPAPVAASPTPEVAPEVAPA